MQPPPFIKQESFEPQYEFQSECLWCLAKRIHTATNKPLISNISINNRFTNLDSLNEEMTPKTINPKKLIVKRTPSGSHQVTLKKSSKHLGKGFLKKT